MRHVRLVACADEYDTKPGFKIKGTPDFDEFMADRDGLLIAHDLLEHQNGPDNMGPVWDEMEALGAIWYVRGQWGDLMTGFSSYHSVHENLASDVVRMFPQWVHGDDKYCGPGSPDIGTRPCDHDDEFSMILGIACRDIPGEYMDMGYMDSDDDDLHESLDLYLEFAMRRMRSGFRKAKKRFERDGSSQFKANGLFSAVRDAVSAAVSFIDYEGQEFRLSYGNGQAHCEPIYEYEEY